MGVLSALKNVRPPNLVRTITCSKGFEKYARKLFSEVDVDSSGHLDAAELYVCLLLLYDQFNSKLPAHTKPPKKAKVLEVFSKYDSDGDGKVDVEEFLKLSRALFLERQNWRDSLIVKIGIAVLLKVAIWPTAAGLLKSGLEKAEVPGAKKVPVAVLSHGLEAVGKVVLAPITP